MKKRVIIIGAGISGLTAGIYLLENGFDVYIFEKHSIPGGLCTGWMRKGVYIDGCAHWIVGTNPNSELFPLWKHIGAFDENSKIYDTDYFTKIDIDSKIYTIYSDLELLRKELYSISIEDKKLIDRLINGIKNYETVHIPTKKPIDLMNPFELTAYGLKFLPMLHNYLKYKKIDIKEFTSKFKSKTLERIVNTIINENFNVHSLLYTMQALSKKDAGVLEGGSLQMALRIKDKFTSLGGKIFFNSNVERINISGKNAYSITVNSQEISGDYFVSSCDAHYLLETLLDNKYRVNYLDRKYDNKEDYPLSVCIQTSYKVKNLSDDSPKMINIPIKPFNIYDHTVSSITLRSHAFDKSINKDYSTITVLLDIKDNLYDYFKSLTKDKYLKEKDRIGLIIKDNIKNYYKLNDDDIELIDVSTPLTYERYTNAYRGSYMSWITTAKAKGLMDSGKIKGLKNVIITGQWTMSPGGLPIALFTGKHAAYRITTLEKRKFINLEDIKKSLKIYKKAPVR